MGRGFSVVEGEQTMTDIEQLRKDVETQSVGPYQDYLALAKAYIEQAAEIERLQKKAQELALRLLAIRGQEMDRD